MENLEVVFRWVGIALVSLLPIVNPFSAAILLISISSHLSQKELNNQILRACIYMTAILVAFLLAGHLIMVAFGISIPGIRIAGGMVIGFIGFRKLFSNENQIAVEGRKAIEIQSDISFSPLAMPSLSGPAAIAVVVGMSSAIDGGSGVDKAPAFTGVILAIFITSVITGLVLRGARLLRRFLSDNGVNNISRILGFILVCIGTQFVINGVRDLMRDAVFWKG